MRTDELRRRTRRGLETATAHLTATEGPLRLALDELAHRGVGARVVKGAGAAALAWVIAGVVTPGSPPFLAALTALFTVQATIKESVEGGRQRLLGVLVGMAVAFGVSEFVGVHAWSVGLVVLVALLVGLRLRLQSGGVEQVAATAILVLSVRTTADERVFYAASLLADTAIGTVVGLLLNALVSPPNYVPSAEAAVRALGRRLVTVLEDLAGALADGASPTASADLLAAAQVVHRELDDVDAALERAEDGLAYNLTGSRQLPPLARCRQVAEELRGVAFRTLTLADTLATARATAPDGRVYLGPLAAPAAEAASAVALALLDRVERVGARDDRLGENALAREVEALGAALRDAAAHRLPTLDVHTALEVAPLVGGVLDLADTAPVGVLIGGGEAGRAPTKRWTSRRRPR